MNLRFLNIWMVVVLHLILACNMHAEVVGFSNASNSSKYILTVSENKNMTFVVHAIRDRVSAFEGGLDRVLHNVGVVIVMGNESTCNVLLSMTGVDECRKDASISFLWGNQATAAFLLYSEGNSQRNVSTDQRTKGSKGETKGTSFGCPFEFWILNITFWILNSEF